VLTLTLDSDLILMLDSYLTFRVNHYLILKLNLNFGGLFIYKELLESAIVLRS